MGMGINESTKVQIKPCTDFKTCFVIIKLDKIKKKKKPVITVKQYIAMLDSEIAYVKL